MTFVGDLARKSYLGKVFCCATYTIHYYYANVHYVCMYVCMYA